MKCYKCKREVPGDARFCPKCGSPLEFTRGLIDRAINNDQPAITQLYDMTKDNVYYTIKTMISDEDTAQDLTQDTFLKAMKYLGQLNEPAAFRGWIKKIARNMTIDVLRKRKVISFSQMVSADSDEAVGFEDDRPEDLPEVVIDRRETTRLIGEILGTLSAEQRVVTELFYYEGFSVKGIAEGLGVSENTVKSRLKYARNKIEIGVKALEKKGTKLYGLAPIPFLLLLLRSQDAYAAELPDADILQAIQSGNASAGAGDGFSGQSADSDNVEGGTAKAATEAAKTGAGTASKGVVTKVIAGIVATAFIGGTIAGIMAEASEHYQSDAGRRISGIYVPGEKAEKANLEDYIGTFMNGQDVHAGMITISEIDLQSVNVRLGAFAIDTAAVTGHDFITVFESVGYPFEDGIYMNVSGQRVEIVKRTFSGNDLGYDGYILNVPDALKCEWDRELLLNYEREYLSTGEPEHTHKIKEDSLAVNIQIIPRMEMS